MTETAYANTEFVPQDVPADDPDFTVPDHTASREERRSILGYITGHKPDEEEAPRRGRPRGRQKKRASTPKKGAFVDPLVQLYGVAALTIMPVDQHCAGVILENAEKCATAVDELAYQNESVRRVLDKLMTGSAIGAVMLAHMPIIIAVASHHGGGKLPFVPQFVPEERPQDQ